MSEMSLSMMSGLKGADADGFDQAFALLTTYEPLRWQRRLYRALIGGFIPEALDLPTGLGKTSVMAIWLIARAHGATVPRRLVYVVDRRAVVDQATEVAEAVRKNLPQCTDLQSRLGLEKRKLPISTLRGQYVDNREWLEDPGAPAIVVGTVDMIGSRLLFCGYGVSSKMRPYHAGLLGADTLVVLDLIATHHGFGRPVIGTSGCDDAPPSVVDGRARDVALRFAASNALGALGTRMVGSTTTRC